MTRITISDLDDDYCRQCGKCCDALYIAESSEAIAQKAARHGLIGMNELESDAIFIVRHFRPLSLREAQARSPHMARMTRNLPAVSFWTCEYHGPDGRCGLQATGGTKPHICKAYPWNGHARPLKSRLLPGCGYRRIFQNHKGHPMK